MVARDASDLNDNDNVSEGIVTNGESLSARIYNNAEIEIPECRKQLLDVKESMFNTADMYQQDYLDKVEERSDLTHEAKEKAVMCLLDVSEKIYNLAGRFQRLIEDQADKLQEIENLTLTASTSLEVASCQNFRTDLVNRVPVSNMPQRQPRIGRPETMQTEFYAENVIWEKLNYNKLDSIGSGGIGPLESDDEHYASILSQSTSQVSLTSVGSSRSHVAPSAASSSLHSPVLQDSRLTASSIDVSRDPTSPALNRCNSSSSLTSTKSEVVTSAHHHRKPTKNNPALVKRSLSSLRLMPSRAAPAPPPSKSKQHRPRVYSVKNETGEGLEKPAIPAPRPPAAGEDEHYAIPPSRMPTVSEEDKECRTTPVPEVIYDQARSGPPPPAPPPPSQYQQIVIESPCIKRSTSLLGRSRSLLRRPKTDRPKTDKQTHRLTDRHSIDNKHPNNEHVQHSMAVTQYSDLVNTGCIRFLNDKTFACFNDSQLLGDQVGRPRPWPCAPAERFKAAAKVTDRVTEELRDKVLLDTALKLPTPPVLTTLPEKEQVPQDVPPSVAEPPNDTIPPSNDSGFGDDVKSTTDVKCDQINPEATESAYSTDHTVVELTDRTLTPIDSIPTDPSPDPTVSHDTSPKLTLSLDTQPEKPTTTVLSPDEISENNLQMVENWELQVSTDRVVDLNFRGGAKSPRGGAKLPRGEAKLPRGEAKSPRGGAKSMLDNLEELSDSSSTKSTPRKSYKRATKKGIMSLMTNSSGADLDNSANLRSFDGVSTLPSRARAEAAKSMFGSLRLKFSSRKRLSTMSLDENKTHTISDLGRKDTPKLHDGLNFSLEENIIASCFDLDRAPRSPAIYHHLSLNS